MSVLLGALNLNINTCLFCLLILKLYELSFQAASFGGTNIDPTAWEDKKTPGESRFPAQVIFLCCCLEPY